MIHKKSERDARKSSGDIRRYAQLLVIISSFLLFSLGSWMFIYLFMEFYASR